MSKPKKGTIHQIVFPMVDSVDFASVESGITESDFNSGVTKKFYGWNTGVSTATTSGAISKVASLVRSGVFRIILKTTENNFDNMMVRVNKTGCAEQILTWSNVDNDDSDIMSAITVGNSRALLNLSYLSDIRSHISDLQSDFQSRVPKAVATNSQLSDLHSDLRSYLVVMSGVLSDVRSNVSDLQSDFQSRVPKLVATASQVSDLVSDLRSLTVAGVGLTSAMISDVASHVWAHTVGTRVDSRILVIQSGVSDVLSAVSDAHSDLASKIGGITVTVTASDMSDIASRVGVVLASDLSDILSAAVQANSRVLLIQSTVSDIRSHVSGLQSDFQSRVPKLVATNSQLSDLHSDLRSYVVGISGAVSDLQSALSDAHSDLASKIGGIAVTVTASDMSDIASRVGVVLASDLSDILSVALQANSRVLLVQSTVSDIRSQVSDLQSDFQSRVPKRVATDSYLSDIHSDLASKLGNVSVALTPSDISDIASAVAAAVTTITASDISDIASAVRAALISDLSDIHSVATAGASRALLNQSRISDVFTLLSDFNSNFNSRVPLQPAGRSQLSDLASDLKSAVLLTQSLASDAASAAQQVNSRVLLTQSGISDIYSLLSDVQSDFQSRVPKRVATDSQVSALVSDIISALAAGVPADSATLSDIRSAIAAAGLSVSDISDIASAVALTLASDLSDILSSARAGSSRALLVQSQASDIYSLLSDVHSDLGVVSGVVSDVYSAIGAGVEVGPSSLSDLRSAITANGLGAAGAEPTGVIGHGDSRGAKIDWLTAASRNKIEQTATLQRIKNDADNDTIASAAVSDDGTTAIRGEFA